MRGIHIVILCVGFSMSLVAHAEFAGLWSGDGDVTGPINVHCNKITLHVTQSETAISEENGKAQCSIFGYKFDDKTWEIRGNELWQNNELAGEIDEHSFNGKTVMTGYPTKVSIEKTGEDTAEFIADVDRNGKRIHIEGQLKRTGR